MANVKSNEKKGAKTTKCNGYIINCKSDPTEDYVEKMADKRCEVIESILNSIASLGNEELVEILTYIREKEAEDSYIDPEWAKEQFEVLEAALAS